MKVVDKHGNIVQIGSLVRLLSFEPRILERLPKDEVIKLNSMLNDIFPVQDIEDGTKIRIEKMWDHGEGRIEVHALLVSGEDVELVK